MTHVDSDTLLVELLYEQEPALDEGQLLAEVNKVLPRTVLAGDDGQQTLLVSYSHLSDPARIDLSQTWAFPQARRVLDQCQAVLTIGERFGRPFPPAQRLDVFRAGRELHLRAR
ncbi:MAG TPA: hypothetical protein VGQ26_09925 [Streptosporangiaceae bacterium]|jgi:hypothetical protein|nr:hypothetical protein [Streptosporangiaceae bacterium]